MLNSHYSVGNLRYHNFLTFSQGFFTILSKKSRRKYLRKLVKLINLQEKNMLWQLVKLWWVQKISPRKIKESVWNVITILMTDYGIWKESRPSVLFAHKKTRQFIDIQQKTSFVFVPVTSSQIFLSPTTTYASSKDKKNKKIIH